MTPSHPLFQPVFGQQWEHLPPALHKRYANRAYSTDLTTVTGKLNVHYSRLMSFLLPALKLVGALVPYQGNDVPVTVKFQSHIDSATLNFDRIFYFSGEKPYNFFSRIELLHDNIVLEFMRFGLAWRASYFFDGSKVIMQHSGYVCKLFGKIIPLPISWLMGKCYAEEEATSENSFRMLMNLTHPLLGKMFEYAGEFNFTDKS
jgi:hypothetical protein